MIESFVCDLKSRGVALWVANGSVLYRAPKGVLTDVDLALLKEHKDDVRRILLNGSHHTGVRVEPRPYERPLVPLSFQQERLWHVDRFGLTGSAFNMAVAFLLRGPLYESFLELSLAAVLARHEALRTRFEEGDEGPEQIIDPPSRFQLKKIDLRNIQDCEWLGRAKQIAQTEIERKFELTSELPFRATLIKGCKGQHLFLILMHHIVSDGWSMAILIRELSMLYNTLISGGLANLPEPQVRYSDYALWQRSASRKGILDQQLSYWCDRLRGAIELELPTDYPRPKLPSHKGAWVYTPPSHGLSQAIYALARDERVTPFMIFMTAFQLLLSRWSGQTDVMVGSPTAGRTNENIENTIGLFVNTLTFRSDLSGDTTFKQLVSQVKETALSAYENQDVPFERIVAQLRPNADKSMQPLVPIKFAMQNMPYASISFSGLSISKVELDPVNAKFDLNLFIMEDAEGFRYSFEYAVDLFKSETMERFSREFEELLRCVAMHPDQRISELR